MQILRRTRVNGWLALLALATQLVLSFGHVHASHPPEAASAESATACDAKTPAPCPARNDNDEQHCSICWTIAIAGSLVLAAPIAVEPPSLPVAAHSAPIIGGQLRQSASVKFQARAPPPSIA